MNGRHPINVSKETKERLDLIKKVQFKRTGVENSYDKIILDGIEREWLFCKYIEGIQLQAESQNKILFDKEG